MLNFTRIACCSPPTPIQPPTRSINPSSIPLFKPSTSPLSPTVTLYPVPGRAQGVMTISSIHRDAPSYIYRPPMMPLLPPSYSAARNFTASNNRRKSEWVARWILANTSHNEDDELRFVMSERIDVPTSAILVARAKDVKLLATASEGGQDHDGKEVASKVTVLKSTSSSALRRKEATKGEDGSSKSDNNNNNNANHSVALEAAKSFLGFGGGDEKKTCTKQQNKLKKKRSAAEKQPGERRELLKAAQHLIRSSFSFHRSKTSAGKADASSSSSSTAPKRDKNNRNDSPIS